MSKELAIKAVNLTKCFGQRISVDHLNLEIGQGEFYALLGDNGAGKTTTLNMFSTLLKPNEGTFYICGHDGLKQVGEVKKLFGIVSQDIAAYLELSAYENLCFTASLYGLSKRPAQKRIAELLNEFGLSERANDRVGTLSTGMQRKLLIVGALLHEPSILFMDEPTVGLDPGARRQLWDILRSLRDKGVTIFLTTHYLEEAEILADRIGIIRQGKLIAEGSMAQLRWKIQSSSSIEIRLQYSLAQQDIQRLIASAQQKLYMQSNYDALHNTLAFMPPKTDGQNKLDEDIKLVLNWLSEEKLSFISLRTTEPDLEDIFLTISNFDKLL